MNKIKKLYKNVNEYIKVFPKKTQAILNKVRITIKKAAPKATETISYQIPTLKLNNTNLVHFAAYKNHIGFYPTASGVSTFKKELSGYKTAKGSIQFPLDKEIPYNLITKITKYRVKEYSNKEKRKSR